MLFLCISVYHDSLCFKSRCNWFSLIACQFFSIKIKCYKPSFFLFSQYWMFFNSCSHNFHPFYISFWLPAICPIYRKSAQPADSAVLGAFALTIVCFELYDLIYIINCKNQN